MGRECNNGCDPQTDDIGIECDGEFTSTDCITTTAIPYLDVEENDSLTELNDKLVARIQNLTNSVGSIWNLPEYLNDTQAESGGLLIGEPYSTPTGEIRIRKV
jgi:hypothetical protein